MWECGLKPVGEDIETVENYVTPYVGVWIETPTTVNPNISNLVSLLMWECGLKPWNGAQDTGRDVSLLMWECGLKLGLLVWGIIGLVSLLMWECGLKHQTKPLLVVSNETSLLMWECGLKPA